MGDRDDDFSVSKFAFFYITLTSSHIPSNYMPNVILACGGKENKRTHLLRNETMRAMEPVLKITLNSLVAAVHRKYKMPATSVASISSRGQLH